MLSAFAPNVQFLIFSYGIVVGEHLTFPLQKVTLSKLGHCIDWFGFFRG